MGGVGGGERRVETSGEVLQELVLVKNLQNEGSETTDAEQEGVLDCDWMPLEKVMIYRDDGFHACKVMLAAVFSSQRVRKDHVRSYKVNSLGFSLGSPPVQSQAVKLALHFQRRLADT